MIYVLGGGQGKGPIKKGTIVVTYPAGSTCAVTNGNQTYTALDTSGAAAFIVEPGTWTVKAVQGSDSDSKSVTVAAGGWIEVELSFREVIWEPYDNNLGECSLSNLWGNSFKNTVTDTECIFGGTNGDAHCWVRVWSNKTYDLTKYSTLEFECTVTDQMSYCYVGFQAEPTGDDIFASYVDAKTGLRSLDISSLNGAYHFKVAMNTGKAGWATIDFSSIVLRP